MDKDRVAKYVLKRFSVALMLLIFSLCLSETVITAFGSGNSSKMLLIGIKAGDAGQPADDIITQTDVDSLKQALPDAAVSYVGSDTSAISAGGKTIPVDLQLTGHMHINFLDIKIIRGSYFTYEASKHGRNVAVISENLAEKLFSTYDVIGRYVYLYGNQKYKIVGLYKGRGFVVSQLLSVRTEKVFIPFESHEGTTGTKIDTVLIKDASLDNEKFRVHRLELLLKGMGIDPGSYRISDFYDSDTIVSQMHYLFIFIAGMPVIWFILRLAAGRVRSTFGRLSKKLDSMYFSELLRNQKRELMSILLIIIGAAIPAAAVFFTIRFKPYIGSGMIPSVFRMAPGYLPSQFEISYMAYFIIAFVLFLMMLSAFAATFSYLRLAVLVGCNARSGAGTCLISLAVSTLLALIVVSATGFNFYFPIKGLLIISGFILSAYCSESQKHGCPIVWEGISCMHVK